MVVSNRWKEEEIFRVGMTRRSEEVEEKRWKKRGEKEEDFIWWYEIAGKRRESLAF